MSIIYINPFQFGPSYDADAQDYIDRVIAADVAAGNTSGLEVGVQDAYNTFFVGCKADGNLSALKASCILAGARTRAGSLVPLLSSMPTPTSFGFADADYNRETGLKGDGSTKYLDSNRNTNDDPQDNYHNAVYVSADIASTTQAYIGGAEPFNEAGGTSIGGAATGFVFARNRTSNATTFNFNLQAGLLGSSRSSSSSYTIQYSGTSGVANEASTTPNNRDVIVFGRHPTSLTSSRLSFYSIGEAVNLSLLRARVATLMSDLAAAIP